MAAGCSYPGPCCPLGTPWTAGLPTQTMPGNQASHQWAGPGRPGRRKLAPLCCSPLHTRKGYYLCIGGNIKGQLQAETGPRALATLGPTCPYTTLETERSASPSHNGESGCSRGLTCPSSWVRLLLWSGVFLGSTEGGPCSQKLQGVPSCQSLCLVSANKLSQRHGPHQGIYYLTDRDSVIRDIKRDCRCLTISCLSSGA